MMRQIPRVLADGEEAQIFVNASIIEDAAGTRLQDVPRVRHLRYLGVCLMRLPEKSLGCLTYCIT
jgi:hypothetical protein